MIYGFDRKIRWAIAGITLIAFPIALVIFMFSGCELRKRSEKAACRAGDVAQCLYVGKYYEDKAGGIISFLMSYSDTAIASYYRACRLKSPVGCERMMYLVAHSEQAKNLSTEETDIADALIEACTASVDGTCDLLWKHIQEGEDWIGARSSFNFDRSCTAGVARACYMLARMHGQNIGGLHNVLPEVLPLYEKACAGGIPEACPMAQAYRDEKAKRSMPERPEP